VLLNDFIIVYTTSIRHFTDILLFFSFLLYIVLRFVKSILLNEYDMMMLDVQTRWWQLDHLSPSIVSLEHNLAGLRCVQAQVIPVSPRLDRYTCHCCQTELSS